MHFSVVSTEKRKEETHRYEIKNIYYYYYFFYINTSQLQFLSTRWHPVASWKGLFESGCGFETLQIKPELKLFFYYILKV